MKSIKDIDLNYKKIFLRVDYNVPLKERKILDDSRIRASLETIFFILNFPTILFIASHLGRPKKEKKEEFSLFPIASHLSKLLNKEVIFLEDCIGEKVLERKKRAKFGEIYLLENLRFYEEEEKNDLNFARELATEIDVYVNDAFSASHRAHASIVGITQFIKEKCAGFQFLKEVENLKKIFDEVKRPAILIIGGAKISDKLGVIKNLLPKVDKVLLGGGVIFTIFKALGYEIGKSIYEENLLKEGELLAKEEKVILPKDILIASEISENAHYYNTPIEEIRKDYYGVDIGKETITQYVKIIKEAKTIIFCGPLGIFEIEPFSCGTREIIKAIAEVTQKGTFSLAGGGDTVAAINKFNCIDKFSFISMAGGATLEFLEGKELPGLKALL
ncbi:MAG: phosphoglycerate kinase [candidate division WOR-3 bacterium]|uniref:Phosphoglycerate kinase n=1 Tax=candidate division WOR-3 bacterium TaxID=2052148 RepID=A0A7C4W029_UNCW3